jgi:hypothetical protein
MTNREFLTAIAKADVAQEIKDFAIDGISKLDHKNELRTSKPSKTAIANEPIKKAILGYLSNKPRSITSDIAVGCGISTQKASALCGQMEKDKILNSAEVKIPKKGKVKAYELVVVEENIPKVEVE